MALPLPVGAAEEVALPLPLGAEEVVALPSPVVAGEVAVLLPLPLAWVAESVVMMAPIQPLLRAAHLLQFQGFSPGTGMTNGKGIWKLASGS